MEESRVVVGAYIEERFKAKTISINTGLESLQELVGGYLECLTDHENGICYLVDENGRLKGLPYTCSIRKGHYIGVSLCGPVVILGISNDDAEDFVDIPAYVANNLTEYIV